jgi:catechol-2,3-dioxygenase
MGITRLNHAVLFVSDLRRSVEFYTNVLGFTQIDMTPDRFTGAAFLRASDSTNDHDLGLFAVGASTATTAATVARGTAGSGGSGGAGPGLYHLAWEVDTLDELERTAGRLAQASALVGSSDHGTTKSLYGKDPDGLEFEIVWLVPADQLDDDALAARKRIAPLDLAREKRRYGAQSRGGVGISTPAPA